MKKLLALLLLCFAASFASAQTSVNSCPNYNLVNYLDKNCSNYLPMPTEIRLGQARVTWGDSKVGNVCSGLGGADIFIPSNRPGWAIAIGHAYNATRNVLKGDYFSINYLAGISMKETFSQCDAGAVWDPALTHAPSTNYFKTNCDNLFSNYLTMRDGCFQIDQNTGWPMFTEFYPTRFSGTADHVNFASGANYETETMLRMMYDLILFRRLQYSANLNPTQFFDNATDPYAAEKVFALAWNKGVNDSRITNLLTTNRTAALSSADILSFLSTETYPTIVSAITRALDSPANITETHLISTNHQWYDAPISWADVDAYLTKQLALFKEANPASVRANVKKVFDSIKGGNPVSYRYEFSKVLDEITTNLPFYDPMPYISNSNSTSLGCKLACKMPVVTIKYEGAKTFCEGQSITLNTIEGSGFTYEWQKNGVTIPSTNSASYDAIASGEYNVIITSGTCKATSECPVKITVNNCSNCTMKATATATSNSCTGKKDGSVSVTLSNQSAGPFKYNWVGPDSVLHTTAIFPNVADGIYNIEVIDQSNTGCKAYANTKVTPIKVAYQKVVLSATTSACDRVILKASYVDLPPASCDYTITSTPAFTWYTFPGELKLEMVVNGSVMNSWTGATMKTLNQTVKIPHGATVEFYLNNGVSYAVAFSSGESFPIRLLDPQGATKFTYSLSGNWNSGKVKLNASTITANCLPATTPTYTKSWTATPTGTFTKLTGDSTTFSGNANSEITFTATNPSDPSCPLSDKVKFINTCPGSQPVDFIYFEGKAREHDVMLNWATSMEKDNKGFQVLRSTDAENFIEIGFVPPLQFNGIKPYKFFDTNPVNGGVYYKIKQIDLDGSSSSTNIIYINTDIASELKVYPNPFDNELTIQLLNHSGAENQSLPYQIDVYDLTDQMISKEILPGTALTHKLGSTLSSGVYLVKITNNNISKVFKVIKY